MSEENKTEGNPLMNSGVEAAENQEATNEEVQSAEVGEAQADPAEVSEPEAAQEEAPEVVPQPEPEPNPTVHTPQPESPSESDAVKYEKRAHKMKQVLQEQPQVQFMIPLGQGEKKGAYDTVQINGYKMTIMKGAMVSLPQQVVDLLAAKYEVDMTAGAEHRVDGDEAKAKALT